MGVKRANVIHRNYVKHTNSVMNTDHPANLKKKKALNLTLNLNSHIKRIQKRILNSGTLSE